MYVYIFLIKEPQAVLLQSGKRSCPHFFHYRYRYQHRYHIYPSLPSFFEVCQKPPQFSRAVHSELLSPLQESL